MRESQSRRELLCVTAAAVAATLAGCGGNTATSTPNPDTPPESMPEADGDPTATPEPSVTSTPTPSETERTDDVNLRPDALAQYLRLAVNEYREAREYRRLSWDSLFVAPTRNHSEAMAESGTVAYDINGRSASARVREVTNCDAGIVIARLERGGSLPAVTDRIVERWARDERSRVILEGKYWRRMGAGAAKGDDGGLYVTAAFC